MLLKTSHFGEVEIEEQQLVSFPKGIPGFPQYKDYAIIDLEDTAFFYLQSMEEPSVGFVMANPFDFFPAYEIDLPESAIKELDIGSPEEVMIRCIVTIQEEFQKSTINLLAPVVMNTRNRQGKQVVLQGVPYPIKQPLFNSK